MLQVKPEKLLSDRKMVDKPLNLPLQQPGVLPWWLRQ